MRIKKIKQRTRSTSGVMGMVFFVLLILIVMGIGCYGSDIAHNVTVRTQLQNAVDAAALGGVQNFNSSNDPSVAENDAIDIAGQNTADGRAVSDSSSGTTVTASAIAPGANTAGSCEVQASMTINNYFAQLFGHGTDTISVQSTANYWESVTAIQANQMFPITVSLTDTSYGAAVGTLSVGDPITIGIQPSGGNAAWTSGTTTHPSTPVIQAALNVALGLAQPTAGANPAMTADGTTQIALTQGLHNGVDITQSPYPADIEAMNYIIIPCIIGSKPYTQSRTLEGFIAVKVTSISSVSGGIILQGTLVKGLVQGSGGTPPGGNTGTSPGTAQLAQ